MVAVIDRARAILEARRQRQEEQEARQETEARGRLRNREEAAALRRAQGKSTQEAFEARKKEARAIYESERKTTRQKAGEMLVGAGQGLLKAYQKPVRQKTTPQKPKYYPASAPRQPRQRKAPKQPRQPKREQTFGAFSSHGLLGSAGDFFAPPRKRRGRGGGGELGGFGGLL